MLTLHTYEPAGMNLFGVFLLCYGCSSFFVVVVGSVLDGKVLPRTRKRTCLITQKGILMADGCPDDIECDNYSQTSECQAYVGMELTIICRSLNEIVCGNEKKSTSGRILKFSSVKLSDSGLYECTINNSNYISSVPYNVSITSDIALGVTVDKCHASFNYNSTLNCYCTDRTIDIRNSAPALVGWFYVFNTNNISVQQQWITSSSQHYHSELGLVISEFNSSSSLRLFKVTLTRYPIFFSSQSLHVRCIITATDYSLSRTFSICLPLRIYILEDPNIFLNHSIPENTKTEEGRSATFECVTFSSKDVCDDYNVNMTYYHSNGNILYETYSTPCWYKNNTALAEDGVHSLKISVTALQLEKYKFHYTFSVANVSVDQNNNSVFSCFIFSREQIQWQKNAVLTVLPRHASEGIESHNEEPVPSVALVVTSVLVTSTAAAAILAVLCVLVAVYRRRKHTHLEPDRVPLTNEFIRLNSDCSTPGSEQPQFPTLQVVEHGNAQSRAMTVMDACREKDQGYDSDQDRCLEDLGSSEAGNAKLLPGTTGKCSTKYFHYTDPSASLSLGDIQGNGMVYISYTDRKADWVYSYLKPMLESWDCQVILHEEDMIPGFSVSGERQRLILQAHRVVLVVSPDYSTSPWCLYELQHAITKEPVLFRGRIIPIMVDGCLTLPILVKGIVPLFDSAKNFQGKLRKNICGHV